MDYVPETRSGGWFHKWPGTVPRVVRRTALSAMGDSMGTRILKTKPSQNHDKADGFTLLEMMIAIAIGIIVTVISVVTLIPLQQQQHVTNAYNITLAAMRRARDNAVAQRTSYSVTLSNSAIPNTIAVSPVLVSGTSTFTGDQSTVTYQLPTDVTFVAQTGLPNSSTTAPDNYFNTSLAAIDLGYAANGYTSGVSTVYFCPDGSAQNAQDGSGNCSGSVEGGVVYLAFPGNLLSSRAVTLWGATGRIRGWRLYAKSGGGYQWLRQ